MPAASTELSHAFFEKHRPLLEQAAAAVAQRGHWTPYPEIPSPRSYGDSAMETGRQAYEALLNKDFPLDQPGQTGWLAPEQSPYGMALGVRYPVCAPDVLVAAAQAAMAPWRRIGPDGRAGVCLEMLARLHARSFEIAHAVMFTSGQGWMMAFQAGSPHAQDRGLEAVTQAWIAMKQIPAETIWEKPQGKNPSLKMRKHYEVVGRGVALVIGCCTFPTWNTYPGLFAALATGNPVIVKPHANSVLPMAITVAIMKEVLRDAGLDPNLVSLAVVADDADTRKLATHPGVKSIDFTGSNHFGHWLYDHARQAQVYAELAGVNHVIVESTDNYAGLMQNMAFSLSLYSGQMCTTPQVLLVPEGGIETDQGHKSFDQVAADLGKAVADFLADPKTACAVLGAIPAEATLARIAEARELGKVILDSQTLVNPDFPQARTATPLLLSCDASNEAAYREERFGPISFVVKVADTAAAIALSRKIVTEQGALTVGLHSSDPAVIDAVTEATLESGVALSINLTGGVWMNQAAAFSDFHGTGMNPAANASYCDAAFVANRFRVVQRRYHIA